MKIELNPCPHCGGEAGLSAFLDRNHEISAYVYCQSCGARSAYYNSLEDSANAWNSRVYTDSEREYIAKLYLSCRMSRITRSSDDEGTSI